VARRLNLDGDGQDDLAGHGGEYREVCIGDRYRIGEAEFEVTQPRVTCCRVGLRMDEPRMAALLIAHGRPGFYLRVRNEGRSRPGTRSSRSPPGRSV
jgi:MOSC domain-containing protein YiiM